ncbi:Translocation protein SEC62, partial [Operophtera brumata]
AKAIDALLTSKWATSKNPTFTTRLESGDEKDGEKSQSTCEGKDTKENKDKDKEKKKRKIRLEMHMEQVFLDTPDAYVWIYDPMPWYYWVCGALVVFGTIGVCMFPLWPATVRHARRLRVDIQPHAEVLLGVWRAGCVRDHRSVYVPAVARHCQVRSRHIEQVFLDTPDAYVWIYDPMPWYCWVCGALVVFGTIGVCMFPLWPATVR